MTGQLPCFPNERLAAGNRGEVANGINPTKLVEYKLRLTKNNQNAFWDDGCFGHRGRPFSPWPALLYNRAGWGHDFLLKQVDTNKTVHLRPDFLPTLRSANLSPTVATVESRD